MMKPSPPQVDAERCTGCSLCVEVCPSFVFEMREGKAEVVREKWCIGCGHCGAVCPEGAILNEATAERIELPIMSPEGLTQLLRQRRSVRLYREEPVPKEVIERVIEAGSYAPTGRNSQNVHWIVIRSPEEITRLREMAIAFYEKIFSRVRSRTGALLLRLLAGKRTVEYLRDSLPKVEYAKGLMDQGDDRLLYNAPVVILVHAESWDTCSPFNCAVALYNASLMAHALGVGYCFNWYLVNAVNHDQRIGRWLKIPSDHRCFGAMTMGYPRVTFLRSVRRRAPKVRWI